MCMFMFPTQVISMDLAKLTRENEREIEKYLLADEEMFEVDRFPPEVEMKKIQQATGNALNKKSPKSINNSSNNDSEDGEDEAERKELEKIGNQKHKKLGNSLSRLVSNLFRR